MGSFNWLTGQVILSPAFGQAGSLSSFASDHFLADDK
jgi:hypothetical protein